MVVVPNDLTRRPYLLKSLQFDGFRVIESCTHTQYLSDSMFLAEHLWVFLRKGTYVLKYGEQVINLEAGDSAFVGKGILLDYIKKADPDSNQFDCLMFFIDQKLVKEFLKLRPTITQVAHSKDLIMILYNEKLAGYVSSVTPYFAVEQPKPVSGLLRLKMLELLFDLATEAPETIQVLVSKRHESNENLVDVMEANYMKRLTLGQFASLCGKSLSAFKREFNMVYSCPPASWLRRKRLAQAKYLLENTSLPVWEVAFQTGFESQAHFSRVFKTTYGNTPSSSKSIDLIRQKIRATQ